MQNTTLQTATLNAITGRLGFDLFKPRLVEYDKSEALIILHFKTEVHWDSEGEEMTEEIQFEIDGVTEQDFLHYLDGRHDDELCVYQDDDGLPYWEIIDFDDSISRHIEEYALENIDKWVIAKK
jgi:hypothetical protein